MIQNKHIIRLSFIGLFILIIAHIVMYRYFMIEHIVLQEIAATNNNIADIYYKQIWKAHNNAATKLQTNNYESLLSDADFIKFSEESVQFLRNSNVTSVALYDKNANKFLASDDLEVKIPDSKDISILDEFFYEVDQYFLRQSMSQNGLAKALDGRSNYAIFPLVNLETDNKTSLNRSVVISYVPIMNDFKVTAVLELTSDVTSQLDTIGLLERRVLITFICIFSIFFIIVLYNTNNAQKIIDQQFKLNQELEEAKARAEGENSAKTQFLANVSHELRTPLNAIIGFSEMMLSETYGKIENKQYVDYIADINNAGKHLLGVINDILDFSKAAADKLQVDNIELDLNKIATSSMRFVKPRAESAGVQLIEKLPKEHIVITADPKRLKQALLNLLSNSVKFTPANGSVTLEVTTNPQEKLVYVKVIDTGIGMSEKDLPKALSSFGQVDNKADRHYEGTGLGLPLTKKLVELINGKFEISSQVGVGTVVTLTFHYDDSIDVS
ncbi:MAG: HAMP domain-containing sensor histidine kinase [Pseudomonadota bacterium]